MGTLWIVSAALALVGLWAAVVFNALVRARNLVREGWSGIDVQLRRRYDLVPNLVETVRAYAGHEADTLARVTALRDRGAVVAGAGQAARDQGELTRALGQLIAVAEAYPELKADANFRQLSEQLTAVEDELQMARRYYNGAARRMNIRVGSFPSNLVARTFGFREAEFFEIEDRNARVAPSIRLG